MKVLVAYDGSTEARHAVQWVTRLGEGTTVTIISVAPTLEATEHIADAVDPTSDLPVHRRQLEEAGALLRGSGIEAEKILRAGNPAEEIISAGTDRAVDLIIVGIRGMSAARRFLIGSVAERVVRHATVPVLVVR